MIRCLSAVAAVLLFVGGLNAAEIQGKITKVDAEKGFIAIKVGDETKEFTVAKGCECECPYGMVLKEGLKEDFLFKEGLPVKITYETKDGKNIAANRGSCWLDGRLLQATFTGTRVLDDPRPDVDCEGAGGLSALRSMNGQVPVLFADGHVALVTKKFDLKLWKAITLVKNTDEIKLP